MSRQLRRFSFPISASLIFAGCVSQSTTSPLITESQEYWFQTGQAELAEAMSRQPNTNQAKNIILFIGDGMGVSTVTAARIFDGQEQGENGEENSLSFEKLPYAALSKTYNTNQQTPDSAGTMTAMVTGIKTKAGFIAVNQIPERGDCKTALQHPVTTFLEQAEDAGLATGIVSTARITHATPASTYAHVTERNWESDDDMPAEAKQEGCKDIAQQLIEFDHGNGIEVALGGGRRHFFPESIKDPHVDAQGMREDGRDLASEWTQKYPRSQYVWDRQQLSNVDPQQTEHLLGLFSYSHMKFQQDRSKKDSKQPSLTEMANTALDILENNTKGYFLMVEAGRIDHGHHAGSAYQALNDTQEFSQTVQSVLDRIDLEETLVIVTADHSHTLTIAGYPTRGNPILGMVVSNDDKGNQADTYKRADDGEPFTTLGYRNGPGVVNDYRDREDHPNEGGNERNNLDQVDTQDPNYRQQSLIPLETETHAAEDVTIYAGGPWAHLFQRTHEQHYIYHVMYHAAQLQSRSQ